MRFQVRLQPPTGPAFMAWVDEDNNWEVPAYPGNDVSDFLSRAADAEIAKQGGIPAQPDPRPAYAYAMAQSWPGSEVLTQMKDIRPSPRRTLRDPIY